MTTIRALLPLLRRAGGRDQRLTTGLAITAHDPTKTPKQFDLTRQSGTQAGKVLPSIYAVKGDELLIMLGKNGKERPADFDTQKIRGIEKETYLRMNK